MERTVLEEFNPWWKTETVPKERVEKYHRPLFGEILKYLNERQIIAIVGLRRVGKTVMLHQLIKHLLEKGTEPNKIFYFSFDERRADFRDVIETFRELNLGPQWGKGRVFVFLDELQKVDDWQNKIKVYYDLYPNIKFIISGSAGIVLEKRAKESLAGRIYTFNLNPFSFREFLQLKGKQIGVRITAADLNMRSINAAYNKLFLFEKEIKQYFNDFLSKGGFPEIVHEERREVIKKYIRSAVIDKVVYQDIPVEFKIEEPELLLSILKIIADNPGSYIEYLSLAKDLKRDRVTISNYFFYLQRSFLLSFLSNYRGRYGISARKMKKAYIADIGIIGALTDRELTESEVGKIVENLIANATHSKNFWKNTYEVDFVIPTGTSIIPIEVKYQEQISRMDKKGILAFLKKFRQKKGIIITKKTLKEEKERQFTILYIPAWLFVSVYEAG